MSRPRAEVPPRHAGSLSAVAAWLEMPLSTLQEQAREETFPRKQDLGYDLLAVVRWQMSRGRGQQRTAGAPESTEEAERRKKIADADKAEMSRDRERGLLVPAAERDADLLAVVQSFVSALENLPPKVVPLLTAARGHQEVDQILRDHIRTMRIQLAAKHSPRAAEVATKDADEKDT